MILIDAGPLVALVDADDQHHVRCVEALKGIREPLGTVWPALTEAMYLLGDVPGAHDVLWEMFVGRGAVKLLTLGEDDMPRMRELMAKYADRPMDLADAALIRVAERDKIKVVFTVDRRDFGVYRFHGRGRITVIP